MNTFNLLITILCAIILFIYSLKGFSQELELLASDSLRDRLAKLTQNRFSGFAIGAILQPSYNRVVLFHLWLLP